LYNTIPGPVLYEERIVLKYRFQQLVEEAKKGDKEAMIQIIENIKPLIYSAIGKYGRGYDREDLYQEACLILVESVCSFDPGRGVPFLSYIKSRIYYGIFNKTRNKAYHLSIDVPLNEGGDETLGDILEDPHARFEEEIFAREDKERLIAALNRLSPKQRQVIELYYFSGMKLREIAKMRNVHYKGVLRLKERALKNLADMMNQKGCPFEQEVEF